MLTPLLVVAGLGWVVGAGWAAFGLVVLALPFVLGWTRASVPETGAAPERA